MLNCELLESFEIRESGFSDFAGEFELKNLPLLQSIKIGKMYSDYSYSFRCCSFVIRGIEMIRNYLIIRSSKSEIHRFWREFL